MPPGGVGGAAAQFQRMGLQGTADIPRPTIRPAANFNAERDTDIIRKAMKGMGKYMILHAAVHDIRFSYRV